MRNIAKTDDNHTDIVKAFRSVPGCLVKDTSRVGSGFPDIIVLYRGRIILVEIKNGEKSPSRRKLTPDQVEFHALWPVSIAMSVDDVWWILGVAL